MTVRQTWGEAILPMFCEEMKGPTYKSHLSLTELQFDMQTKLN